MGEGGDDEPTTAVEAATEEELTLKNTLANSTQTSQTEIAPKKKKKKALKKERKPSEPLYLPDGTLNYHMGTNSGKGPEDPNVPAAFKKLENQGTYVSSEYRVLLYC